MSTLLLTLRCYDVIRNKKRFFDNKYYEITCLISDIAASIILGIVFLLIDRAKAEGNISYRYDVRDRCSYWCWLEHSTSLGCFGFYAILLVFNIIYSIRTYCFLKKGYIKLKEESEFPEDNDTPAPLVKTDMGSFTDGGGSMSSEEKKLYKNKITNEEIERIKKANLARIKSLIYPLVTIIYWTFAAIYRIIDDIVMMKYDGYGVDPTEGSENEKKDFKDNPSFLYAVEFFFVTYTFFSAIRGILYGFSFLAFEEKICYNFFERLCKFCLDEKTFMTDDDTSDQEKQRPTEMSSSEMFIYKKDGNNNETKRDNDDDECDEVDEE